MPRRSRDCSPASPPDKSRGEDAEFEILCQNSDVAISVPLTSKAQNVKIKNLISPKNHASCLNRCVLGALNLVVESCLNRARGAIEISQPVP
jgi:hypothetical protein